MIASNLVPPSGRDFGLRNLYERYGPWLALGLGCLVRAVSDTGVDFAPKAVALLTVAWALTMAIARRGAESRRADRGWRAAARSASAFISLALFRNVLFFLVPIWYGSASLTSLNMAFPTALAAMALLSCFPRTYQRAILERPRVRTLWCGVILFAALVPAAAVTLSASPRVSIALAAGLSFVIASAALLPGAELGLRRLSRLIAPALVVSAALTFAAPALPPVPVVCHDAAIGTGLKGRALEGAADRLPAGTRRAYGWFAITLPAAYRQGINFQWHRDGAPVGRRIPSSATGGRVQGFRTWSYVTAPAPGKWRVDLLTDGGQLICRKRVVVE